MNQKTHWIVLSLALLLLAITSCANSTEVNMTEFELTGTGWWVEDIDGKGVIDMSHTTLQFMEQGGVADTGLLHLKEANGNTIIRAWRVEE